MPHFWEDTLPEQLQRMWDEGRARKGRLTNLAYEQEECMDVLREFRDPYGPILRENVPCLFRRCAPRAAPRRAPLSRAAPRDRARSEPTQPNRNQTAPRRAPRRVLISLDPPPPQAPPALARSRARAFVHARDRSRTRVHARRSLHRAFARVVRVVLRCGCVDPATGARRVCVPPEIGWMCKRTDATLVKMHVVLQREKDARDIAERQEVEVDEAANAASQMARDFADSDDGKLYFFRKASSSPIPHPSSPIIIHHHPSYHHPSSSF